MGMRGGTGQEGRCLREEQAQGAVTQLALLAAQRPGCFPSLAEGSGVTLGSRPQPLSQQKKGEREYRESCVARPRSTSVRTWHLPMGAGPAPLYATSAQDAQLWVVLTIYCDCPRPGSLQATWDRTAVTEMQLAGLGVEGAQQV